ncbi:MAG: hypothetical protein Q9209_007850 [Squamulea sp. 1 TL-2023]
MEQVNNAAQTTNVKQEQSVSPEPEVINVRRLGRTQEAQEKMIPRKFALSSMPTLPRSLFDMVLTPDLRVYRGIDHSGSGYGNEPTRGIDQPHQSLVYYTVDRDPDDWDIVTSRTIAQMSTGSADSPDRLNAPNLRQSLADRPASYTYDAQSRSYMKLLPSEDYVVPCQRRRSRSPDTRGAQSVFRPQPEYHATEYMICAGSGLLYPVRPVERIEGRGTEGPRLLSEGLLNEYRQLRVLPDRECCWRYTRNWLFGRRSWPFVKNRRLSMRRR